MEGIIRW